MPTSGSTIHVHLHHGDIGVGLFHPGETVSGEVHMHIQNEFHVKAVMLKVKGTETASFKDTSLSDSATIATPYGSTFLNEHKHLKVAVPLMEPPHDGMLKAGQYSIPFSFTLPPDCSPSITLADPNFHCCVAYKVKAVCKLAGMNADLQDSKSFEVTGERPANHGPLVIHDDKKVHRLAGLGNAGHLQVDVSLDRDVWFAGDRVAIIGTINNDSSKVVDSIHFRIDRVITIHKHGHTVTEKVTQKSLPGIPAHAKGENLHLHLHLPYDLVPTCHGKAFSLHYVLSVDCDIAHVKDPESHVEIVVCAARGTAPPHLPLQSTLNKWEPLHLPPVVIPTIFYTC
eukprot:GGOE01010657.1.p1 GENE.GGOE01010657.1~~GGOE01010657.1.p1  ORF type:complete len:341 (+),score=101.50 GGOE01010657.1:46-1068(+)